MGLDPCIVSEEQLGWKFVSKHLYLAFKMLRTFSLELLVRPFTHKPNYYDLFFENSNMLLIDSFVKSVFCGRH